MKITNRHNLPAPILEAIRRDPYSKGDAHFSVTELIDAPRIHALRQRHFEDIEKDASDLVFSILGRAVHTLLESYGRRAGLAEFVEQRYFAEIDGFRLSGGMDLQMEESGGRNGERRVDICDWKLTTAKSASGVGKIEWERQLNLYALLYALERGRQPDGLLVCAIVRDWKKEMANARPDYPQAPIVRIPVRLWTAAEQEAYLRERVALHAAARASQTFGEDPPLCSDEDRWKRGGSWALWKDGNKRATAIFYDEAEAQKALEEARAKKGDFRLDHRPAQPHRCAFYCDVAPFCSQWAEEQKALNLKELEFDED